MHGHLARERLAQVERHVLFDCATLSDGEAKTGDFFDPSSVLVVVRMGVIAACLFTSIARTGR